MENNEKSGGVPSAPYDAFSNHPPPPPPYSPYPTVPELDKMDPYSPTGSQPIGFQQPAPTTKPSTTNSSGPNITIVTPQPATTVVAPQQVIVTAVPLGPKSIRMKCPFCQGDVSTATVKEPSILAWISAAVLFFVGCAFGCCLIPLCMSSCKTTRHHCPKCRRFIGKYSQY